MVLYYNTVKSGNSYPNDKPIVETLTEPIVTEPSEPSKSILNAPSKNVLSNFTSNGHSEFYYTLLEDNFNNLSIDDKLIIMHRTSILRSNVVNNNILMCLAVLIIIALKLYSK
jgi:hypothetical protein